MMIEDFCYRGRLEALDIAFAYAVTTALSNEHVLRHDCDPCSAHLLCRALNSGVLTAAVLGDRERINLNWKYDGQLRSILVDAGQDGTVRGCIQPVHLGLLAEDRNAIYGEGGRLNVVRTQADKIINSGTTETALQDEVADLGYYFSLSEQLETGICSMVGFDADAEHPVHVCRGLMIQALPGCDFIRFDQIRSRLTDASVTGLISRPEEADSLFEDIMNALTGPKADPSGLQFDSAPSPHFSCTCNRDKMAAVVQSLPEQDRREIISRGEDLLVRCQFCREKFELSIEECSRHWS